MESSISRLVVLGASGNVGLPIVKAALARKLKVLAISRNASSKIQIKDENLKVADVDLSKEGALNDILNSDDTVIFCAADHTGDTHEEIIKNTFKALEEKKVKRALHTGGTTLMKIDAERRLYDTEDVQRKYPYYVTRAKRQVEITTQTKVEWTEVAFGVVIPGAKTPESGTAEFWGKEWKLIEFTKPLEDVEILSIPLLTHYVMSEPLAEKILDIASKQVYLRQRVAFNNGLFVPK